METAYSRERADSAWGSVASDAIAFSMAKNQRKPVSPACCDSSHSRISSASRSAWADILTRKVMLTAHVGEEFGGGAGASSSYVVMAAADAFRSLLEILPLPF